MSGISLKWLPSYTIILRIYAIYINMYWKMSIRKNKITRQRNYSLDSTKYYPKTVLCWCRRNESVWAMEIKMEVRWISQKINVAPVCCVFANCSININNVFIHGYGIVKGRSDLTVIIWFIYHAKYKPGERNAMDAHRRERESNVNTGLVPLMGTILRRSPGKPEWQSTEHSPAIRKIEIFR